MSLHDQEESRNPKCDICGHEMWIARIETKLSDEGTLTESVYECSVCGAKQVIRVGSDKIVPVTSVDSLS